PPARRSGPAGHDDREGPGYLRREPERGSRRREEDIGEKWPDLPEWATAEELDLEVRRDLRGLSKEGADWVAAHLVAASTLADEEPETAWRHARAARARGGRIGVVRETVGLVAYRAGEWAEAIGELRAARRMGGGPGHLAVLADCERALGHPEKAIELSRSTEADELDPEASIELSIVVAGARADLDQVDVALANLERLGLDRAETHPRLAYAYADLLLKAGREQEALSWFIRSANADADEETDALDRVAELSDEESEDEDRVTSPPAADKLLDDEDLELSPGIKVDQASAGYLADSDSGAESAPAAQPASSTVEAADDSTAGAGSAANQVSAAAQESAADQESATAQSGVGPGKGNEDGAADQVSAGGDSADAADDDNANPADDGRDDAIAQDPHDELADGSIGIVPPLVFSDDTQTGDR
ncbi:MAG: tetratricopeptide repeat protein, partial [Nakamurella sp.]